MDTIPSVAIKLVFAFILGAVIGLERDASHSEKSTLEHKIPHSVAGLRTFSLIAVLGSLAGILSPSYSLIALALIAAVFLMIVVFYVLQSYRSGDPGMTTEVVMLYCCILGFLISVDVLPMQLLIAMTILLVLVLSRKDEIRKLTFGLHRAERNAFISYALIAVVILPFLPNRGFALSDIHGLEPILANYGISLGAFFTTELINPSKLWLIVALITGIDIAGYILSRAVGKTKGRLISSCVGGIVSSTATTQAIAQQSRKSSSVDSLVSAAVFSTMFSFFTVMVLVGTINGSLLVHLTPTIACIMFTCAVVGGFFAWKAKNGKEKDTDITADTAEGQKEIFSLRPALGFALLFMCVRIMTAAALVLIGQKAFLLASALTALTGIDAATINVAELAGGAISYQTAVFAFILINGVNMLAKSVYSFLQGKREFAIKFGASMLVLIVSSTLGLLLF